MAGSLLHHSSMIRLMILLSLSVASVFAGDHQPLQPLKAFVETRMEAASAKTEEWLDYRLQGGLIGQEIRELKKRGEISPLLEARLESVLAKAKKSYTELKPMLFERERLSAGQFVEIFNY